MFAVLDLECTHRHILLFRSPCQGLCLCIYVPELDHNLSNLKAKGLGDTCMMTETGHTGFAGGWGISGQTTTDG